MLSFGPIDVWLSDERVTGVALSGPTQYPAERTEVED